MFRSQFSVYVFDALEILLKRGNPHTGKRVQQPVPAVAGVRGKVSCGLRENTLTVAEGSNASEQLGVYTFPDTPAQFSYAALPPRFTEIH